MATVSTLGFAGKNAERFFDLVAASGARRLIDVRLHNTSQLAGFTKRDDLAYFLRRLCDVEYRHEPVLSPSEELFQFRKKAGGGWAEYSARFLALLGERRVESLLDPELLAKDTILLCTEPEATECHRRLVAEYLHAQWGGFAIKHL